MNNLNYYEEILERIKSHIKANEYKQAFNLLVEEKKMPYIPSKYELEIHNLFELVRPFVEKDVNTVGLNSIEDLMDLLMGEDDFSQVQALEILEKHNIRPFKQSLKSRIESWSENEVVKKAYLFELMIDQQIDIDIEFRKGQLLNPSKTISIVETPEVEQLLEVVEKLTFKEPTIYAATVDQVRQHLLMNYPLRPQDPEVWGKQLVNVVRYMHGEQILLTEEEKTIIEQMKK